MNSSSKYSARAIVSALVAYGVSRVVVAPGSRNIPLLLALEAESDIEKFPVLDERCAAFMALGMAVESGSPVACVCTSGTAVLNFAPAVAEALYRGVPLIVISADRPQEWIDHDDSQTIRQYSVLSNIVKASYNIFDYGVSGAQGGAAYKAMVNRTLNDALSQALSRKPGPVHINVEFDVPLGDTGDFDSCFRKIECEDISVADFDLPLHGYRRIMIVAGFHSPDTEYSSLLFKLWTECGIPVLCEAQSNVSGISAAMTIDALRGRADSADFAPDLIISVGGSVLSAGLKSWLRKNERLHHWFVGFSDKAVDCYRRITRRYQCRDVDFLRSLYRKCSEKTPDCEFSNRWTELFLHTADSVEAKLSDAPWCGLKAVKMLMDASGCTERRLHISNGMAIRYAQYGNFYNWKSVECNRGVSGIDGSSSTAAGAAAAGADVMLISGDMSAQYDVGALALKQIPDSFRMVVLDNNGGGIFRVIKSTGSFSRENLERYLSANINLPLKQLAIAYGFDYYEVCSEEDMIEQYPRFLSSANKAIMRVVSDSCFSVGSV